MKKIHYPNLNFLRFLAALMVIIHHTEQLKLFHGYANLWEYLPLPKIEKLGPVLLIGKLGVDLFFVLSGFLITSLLFIEEQIFHKIDIKKFLMRRVLRIWPLYFLILVIGFFIAPYIPFLHLGSPFVPVSNHFKANFLLYLFFLPQIQLFIIGPIAYCSQAWSIGIEEYFYLFWPFLVNKFKLKNIGNFIIGFVIIYIIIMCAFYYLAHSVYANNSIFQKINYCVTDGLKFDCLLIGAFFAIVNNRIGTRKVFINSSLFQFILYGIEVLLIVSGRWFGGLGWEIHAMIYGFIILNLVRSETSIVKMEYRIFDFLGKISYGIYMYHFLIINIVLQVVYKFNVPYLLYPIGLLAVILVASLSYYGFERYFLRKKITYSNIITG